MSDLEGKRDYEGMPETATVYTNKWTGQKYVKSSELIRTKKAQRQMKRIREMPANTSGASERGGER